MLNRTQAKKIKKILIDRDITARYIATAIGESERMVYYVLRSERKNPRIRQKIADFLNIDIESIFPSKKTVKRKLIRNNPTQPKQTG